MFIFIFGNFTVFFCISQFEFSSISNFTRFQLFPENVKFFLLMSSYNLDDLSVSAPNSDSSGTF